MSSYFDIFIGTYTTDSPSRGIYHTILDIEHGTLTEPNLVFEIKKPSFLAIHPTKKYLYSVTEGDPGMITALQIDEVTKQLSFMNSVLSGGRGPCHLTVSADGNRLFVANYVSGSAASIPINSDGTLGEPIQSIQHSGNGPVTERQEGPHVHSINLSPDNNFAYVADLGIDKVMIYGLNPKSGAMSEGNFSCFCGVPGSGPRHLTFHQNGRFVYLINELNNTVTALLHNTKNGELSKIQAISSLPDGASQEGKTAEIKVHPNGRFLYGSNRGHDSMVIYEIDQETGKLTLLGFQNSGIDEPRHFNIDPTGRYCIVGNQDTNTISLFKVSLTSGLLTPTGITQSVGKPICILII